MNDHETERDRLRHSIAEGEQALASGAPMVTLDDVAGPAHAHDVSGKGVDHLYPGFDRCYACDLIAETETRDEPEGAAK
jgi:hypothetical protein